jgi:hypothetical protein
MDLEMVKQEQGETLRQYMWRFFHKRVTVVDVTKKEVIDLFQDGLYHHRTFEDFGRRHPSSITKLKDKNPDTMKLPAAVQQMVDLTAPMENNHTAPPL